MSFTLIAVAISLALFLAMLGTFEIGRRMGVARLDRNPEGLPKGVASSEAAVFAMLGLIVAFTFSAAASRFLERRHLVTEETNAIGTAYLRIDVLPEDSRPELRDLFRRYLEVRLATYQDVSDPSVTEAKLAEAATLQDSIWTKAIAASRRSDVIGRPEILLAPALNQMFDITTTRKAAALNHSPVAIYVLLCGLSLVGSMVVGYGTAENKRRPLFHPIIFAALTSLAFYVIVDLEFPRLGLIHVNDFDQIMADLRKTMK